MYCLAGKSHHAARVTARGTHQLPHLVYGNAARHLGHAVGMGGPEPVKLFETSGS
jgi:hypothetical protein